MNYTITEVFLDVANKYRVRVKIDEYSTHFFKFDHYPTQEEVNSIVENYISANQISELTPDSFGGTNT